MPNLRPLTQKQFIVQMDTLTGMYFSKVTAPKESREVVEYTDGQTGAVYKMPGFISRENVTLAKPFSPEQDKALVSWYNTKKAANAAKFTITIQPVNADQAGSAAAAGATLALTGCEVVSLKMPDVDRMGSGLAMIEIEVLYDGWTLQ